MQGNPQHGLLLKGACRYYWSVQLLSWTHGHCHLNQTNSLQNPRGRIPTSGRSWLYNSSVYCLWWSQPDQNKHLVGDTGCLLGLHWYMHLFYNLLLMCMWVQHLPVNWESILLWLGGEKKPDFLFLRFWITIKCNEESLWTHQPLSSLQVVYIWNLTCRRKVVYKLSTMLWPNLEVASIPGEVEQDGPVVFMKALRPHVWTLPDDDQLDIARIHCIPVFLV